MGQAVSQGLSFASLHGAVLRPRDLAPLRRGLRIDVRISYSDLIRWYSHLVNGGGWPKFGLCG